MDEWNNVTEEEREKFWSRVAIKGPEECWLWTGATQKPGPKGRMLPYGWARFRSVQMNTHRVAWMISNDAPIPPGLVVRHSCHNPQCCNPKHLSTGTVKDNIDDMVAAGRHRPGNGKGRTKHPVTYEEAKAMFEMNAASISMLSAITGRAQSTIHKCFKQHGFELPNRRRTDDDWREMAALDLPGFNHYMARFNVAADTVRKHFLRLGLPIPRGDDPRREYRARYPDDHWRELAARNYASMIEAVRETGHHHPTICLNFNRLGLPLPPLQPGRGRPRTINPNPTNNNGAK